jgi:sporulation protein YlmC with PRC-barrel domain
VPAIAQNGANPANPTTTDQPLPRQTPQPTLPAVVTPAPAAGGQAAAPAHTNKQVAATDKFLSQQQDGQMLASNVMGQTVYDSSGNNLGSVNDIVLDKDGKMAAVVIGVGGFLGIGQKNVAVSIEAIDRTTDENGNLKLVLNASKDEIDQAPGFTTLADLKAKEQQQMQPQPPAGGALAPAPSPGAAPAPANPNTNS